MPWFRILRITVLLAIFIGLAFYAKTQKLKSRAWIAPLKVVIFPINGDGSDEIDHYIDTLDDQIFSDITAFFSREAARYPVIAKTPFELTLGPKLSERPPPAPKPGDNILSIIWWGLHFRYWSYRHTPDEESNLQRIRVFALFHEARKGRKLRHSLGLDKGLLAVVHVFATRRQAAQNNIVIAHELLHTVGASDKYGPDNQPVFPDGYADPKQQPLYPQQRAEIMAGRIPVSGTRARMADHLDQCVINARTAEEINWLKTDRDL